MRGEHLQERDARGEHLQEGGEGEHLGASGNQVVGKHPLFNHTTPT